MAGYIISILGGKGGVGKSQVAANLAFAFAGELRTKVLLADFDQKACGDQSIITGLKPPKTLNDLAQFNGALDPRTITQFIATHKTQVSYLSMPTDPTTAENINVEALGKSLKAIPNIFPLTVIDIGSELTPLAYKALEHSTLIFLVVNPDILALNQTKRIYSDLMTSLFPKDMVQLIVNQFQKGHPVSPDVIGRQIGKPVFGIIPRDDQACTIALNKSQPAMIIAKNSSFAKGVVECVRKINSKNVLKVLAKLNKPDPSKIKDVKGGDKSKGPGKPGKDPKTDLKLRIHAGLVEEMNLSKQNEDDPKEKLILREKTKKVVVELLSKEDIKGIIDGRDDMNRIVKEILDEALGLGPLEDLLSDKTVSEIMVVGPYTIYYEKSGKIKLSDVTFSNDRQVLNVIERIVSPIGRRIDEKTPYVDARLEDGSRVHAIIPPCALNGGTITIRKFPDSVLTYKELVGFGSMSMNMADFLRIAVEGHRNMVVSGGTGSGKTTLINMLGGFIPSDERIITCEDSAELNLPQPHVVRLETKPPSLEGEGAVDIRCLIKQCLRMRPDRIIVGECRGAETLDMLQAMGTGHDGSLTTIHSNNPRDCCQRIETLVQYAGIGLPGITIRKMIAGSVHMIVQQNRMDDGTRKITHITEIGGVQGDVITLQDIFVYTQEGINKQGKIDGKFQSSGFIPKFIELLEAKGFKIPRGIFTNAQETK